MLRKALPRLFIVLVAVLGTLCAVEVGIRFYVSSLAGNLKPMIASVVRGSEMEYQDAVLNHSLFPNKEFIATGEPAGTEFVNYGKINHAGMNDDEVRLNKTQGEKRILVLGDSFVEARQVSRGENFCDLLELKLNEAVDYPVSVINAGVSSYSTIINLVNYREYHHKLKADIVLLMFFSNDVFDDIRYELITEFDKNGVPLKVASGNPWMQIEADAEEIFEYRRMISGEGLSEFWSETFYLTSYLSRFLAIREAEAKYPEPPVNDEFFILKNKPELTSAQLNAWNITAKYMGMLVGECRKHNAEFMLSSVPLAGQLFERNDYFIMDGKPSTAELDQLRKISTALNVPFIELYDALKEVGESAYFPRDGHWTEEGHAAVADALYEHIFELLR